MRKTITIGDLGTVITGKTPPTTNKNYYGDYAVFIKPTDISESSKFTYETEEMYSKVAAEKYSSSLIPKGAICVPCIGTIGTKMTMTHCACFTNQSINSIVCNDKYDNEYVYYLIKYFLPDLKSYNKGTASGREYVSKSSFESIELQAEQDIDIQRKIGQILSRYDALIENYQRQIKLLEEAAQRLYKEWFVDLRFPGHETTKIVDGVPEGWEMKPILDVYDFKYGKILPTKELVDDGHIPVYGASKRIGFYIKANCFEPKVLVGSRGNAGYVHRTYEQESYVTNNSFIVIPQSGFEYLMLPYIFEAFKAIDFVAICTGAAQPQLTLNTVASLQIVLPQKNVVVEYLKVSSPFFDRIDKAYEQIRHLSEARDRLLPKLMNGEIEV